VATEPAVRMSKRAAAKVVKGKSFGLGSDAATDAFDTGKYRDEDFFLDVTPRSMNHQEIGLSTLEDAMGRPVNNNMSLEGALREATLAGRLLRTGETEIGPTLNRQKPKLGRRLRMRVLGYEHSHYR